MISEFRNFKVYIFAGHFGSGKTEVAVNFALELKKYVQRINIIDMDIVNPFFRTVDFTHHLSRLNINVVASRYAGSNLEMPSIPHNIPFLLNEKNSRTILDVGGDDIGARILAGYREYIITHKHRVYCVINVHRPGTDSPRKIESMIRQIEETSKIRVTALVNNSNLSLETDAKHIIEGQSILEQVSRQLNIPVAFTCANEHLLGQLPQSIGKNILIHKIKVMHPWE